MFTGIIEHVGTVLAVRTTPAGRQLRLDVGPLAGAAIPGASIAVDGACLTVCTAADTWAQFDVVPETLRRTTLGALKPGERVNLERAMTAAGRFDGHFVQGHVDTTATVVRADRAAGEVRLAFELDEASYAAYVAPKGCIAVDGVSLTVVDIDEETFSVALVPTTLARTTLGERTAGQKVNVETDILARIVVSYLRRMGTGGLVTSGNITFEQLREAGWL